jgi:hypothetical protein
MSDAITILNGGEAPHHAKSTAGPNVAGADQGALMHQSGGQAPTPGVGGPPSAPADEQPQEETGGDDGGTPPLGGAVHSG